MVEVIGGTIFIVVFLALSALCFWCLSWFIRDVQSRGEPEDKSILPFLLLGPFWGWFLSRPGKKLVDKQDEEFENAEDALFAASSLDSLGEWDKAISLYQFTSERWPEHQLYAEKSIEQIRRKQAGASAQS